MLTDHIRWKKELDRLISEMVHSCSGHRTPDKDFAIEKSFLISGFVLRKLLEAGKVSEETQRNRLHVKAWPCKLPFEVGYLQLGKLPTGGDTESFLDSRFEGSLSSESLSHRKVADIVVHSSTLWLRSGPEGSIVEVLVNSDRTREKIYCIRVEDYCQFLSAVAEEELASFSLVVDTKTGRSWPTSTKKKPQNPSVE